MIRILALLAISTAACDQCTEGASRCVGLTAQLCHWEGDGPGSHLVWESSPCQVACVITGQGALCADSTTPVPECQRDGDGCWSGGITHCVDGYPSDSQPCGDGTSCVVAGTCGAFCAVDANPDPRCGPEQTGDGFFPPPGSFCDGGVLSACNCSHVVWRADCGAPDLCHPAMGQAVCLLSSTPEPRCGATSLGFCYGNTATSCWDGYRASASDCTSGTCVIDETLGAECQYTVPTS